MPAKACSVTPIENKAGVDVSRSGMQWHADLQRVSVWWYCRKGAVDVSYILRQHKPGMSGSCRDSAKVASEQTYIQVPSACFIIQVLHFALGDHDWTFVPGKNGCTQAQCARQPACLESNRSL